MTLDKYSNSHAHMLIKTHGKFIAFMMTNTAHMILTAENYDGSSLRQTNEKPR